MRGQRGMRALEALIIVVVICTVIAIGLPVLHRGASAAILDSNLQSLGTMVNEKVSEGYSPAYKASGEGDAQRYVSSVLEEDLKASGVAVYANPFVAKSEGTAVINAHQVSFAPGFVAPAVLLTDAADWQHIALSDLSPGERRLLAGALVVAFNSGDQTIDVYFIDHTGQRSRTVISVPTGPVRGGRRG
jgi:hypothetical protein